MRIRDKKVTNTEFNVGFQAFAAASMKMTDVMPCSLVETNKTFQMCLLSPLSGQFTQSVYFTES
jgi:hypothetical protein